MKTLVKRFLTFTLIMVMLFTSVPFVGVDLQVGAIDGRVEQAVQTAIAIANDNSHGYSQSSRRGPDYDCSSLVYYAFSSAGFSLSPTWFNTANMGTALKNAGFIELDPNSTSPQRGDILWKTGHTEMHIGDNQLVGAHSDYGSPQTGDQSGNEISVGTYYHRDQNGNLNWEKIYRYKNYTSPPTSLSVKINKYVLNVDESFTITCTANEVDHYWIGFYLDNILIKDITTASGVATVSLSGQGKYSVVVSAVNSQGEINAYSSVVVGDASAYAPETPDVTLSSYILDVGEQLTISFLSNRVEEYWLGIYKSGVLIESFTPTSNEYITSFEEIGKYSVTVTAINRFGETYKNIWFTIGKYSVTYNANDCNDVPLAQTKAYGTDLILSQIKPTKQNYSFIEWNTKEDGKGVSYKPGDVYSENTDLTLYAIWEPTCEHHYISTVTQQPTCTEKGVKENVCSVCNNVYYENIEELGHNYIANVTESTCTNQGFTTYECSRCLGSYIEDYTEPLNHSSFSWLTVVNPTITSEGLAEKRCDYCGEVLDQFTIPCLAPDYVTGIVLSSEKETVSIGDTFSLSATVLPDTAKNKNVVWSSRNSEIAAVDNGTVAAVKPGTTAIVAKTEDGGYIAFCLVRVTGIVAFNGAVVDNDKNIIYGLSSNLLTVDSYLETADNNMTITLSTPTVGTGTFINVTDNGEIIDSYEAVIFGDVNGDGWYDGTDSIIVSCLANGLLSKDDVSPAFYTAADCNHDGVIDSFDVAILEQAGLLLSNVDQSKSNDELATDEAFIEYLNLIDQTPEDEIVDDEIIETPEVETETDEFDFIEFIITIIKKFFELLISSLPIK